MELSLDIDASGKPQKLMFLEPRGDDLDRFALQIVESDRFTPATVEGVAAPVHASIDVKLKSCIEDAQTSSGKELRLRATPEQRLGPPREIHVVTTPPPKSAKFSVSAPSPLNSVVAQFSPEGLKKHITGFCLISLIVDLHGMPQNPRVVKSLEPGMDQNALIAVKRYRFRPAIKNGIPVPVMITVQVNFRLG